MAELQRLHLGGQEVTWRKPSVFLSRLFWNFPSGHIENWVSEYFLTVIDTSH